MFTESEKVTETSPAGKKYSKTVRVTYVDFDGDGKATAIDMRTRDLGELTLFLAEECPSEFKRFDPRLRAISVRIAKEGSKSSLVRGKVPGTGMGLQSRTRDHDNRETIAKVWKQFIQPVVNKAEAALKVAERDWERNQRDRGRSR